MLAEIHIFGQQHGQVGGREGHHAAGITIDDRNGATPVTLARHAPIPQAISHLACAVFVLGEVVNHFLLCLFHIESIEKLRIDERSISRPAVVMGFAWAAVQ